ncbi:hypothetical protein KAW38_00325 [Candidatus Micrarchaeota archaeon]|nr:hypothetical protein [Candidatus Micrarchaeota archaeon]
MRYYFPLFALFIAILLVGCIGPAPDGETPELEQNETPADVEEPGDAEVQEEEPAYEFQPFALTYVLDVGEWVSGEDKINIVYWFEEETECSGRTAIRGIGKMFVQGQDYEGYEKWFKFTFYEDNWEFAMSQMLDKSELLFDTAISSTNEMNVVLVFSDVSGQSDFNLVENDMWISDEPTLIKNIVSSDGIMNYSIVMTGEDTEAVYPCTIFDMAARSETDERFFAELCMAKPNETNKVPFAVWFSYEENEQEIGWELTEFSYEKSGVSRLLQCLEPVYCDYVPRFTWEEEQECYSQGKVVDEVRDERGCLIEVVCREKQMGPFEVEVISPDGEPIIGLEVDLWIDDTTQGPPNVGIGTTDTDGIVVFEVEEGCYNIGFNVLNFPEEYEYPPLQMECTSDSGFDHFTITLEEK